MTQVTASVGPISAAVTVTVAAVRRAAGRPPAELARPAVAVPVGVAVALAVVVSVRVPVRDRAGDADADGLPDDSASTGAAVLKQPAARRLASLPRCRPARRPARSPPRSISCSCPPASRWCRTLPPGGRPALPRSRPVGGVGHCPWPPVGYHGKIMTRGLLLLAAARPGNHPGRPLAAGRSAAPTDPRPVRALQGSPRSDSPQEQSIVMSNPSSRSALPVCRVIGTARSRQ